MPALREAEVQARLARLPGWALKGNAVEKRFALGSFALAIEFVQAVAELTEAEAHHPDIVIQSNQVTLSLSTHSQGGVTEKDLAMAEKIEDLARP